MIRISFFYLITAFLFSCVTTKDKKNGIAKTDTVPGNNNEVLIVKTDSVELPAFEIELNLSQKAEEKLKANKETIIIAAYFSGTPKDTTLKEYVKHGEYAMMTSEKELDRERITKFEGIKFSRALYDTLVPETITLLINVYSGRRSIKDNILDVEILHKTVTEIKGRKFVLKGKLIGE